MKAVLSSNPSIVVLASEEDDTAITCGSSSSSGGYAVVFDPLDGSRNIDAAIPTGTGSVLYRIQGRQLLEQLSFALSAVSSSSHTSVLTCPHALH
jgi:fructose-1,6-bisphosphatase